MKLRTRTLASSPQVNTPSSRRRKSIIPSRSDREPIESIPFTSPHIQDQAYNEIVQVLSECNGQECADVVNHTRDILTSFSPEIKERIADEVSSEQLEIVCKEVGGFADICLQHGQIQPPQELSRDESEVMAKSALKTHLTSHIEEEFTSKQLNDVATAVEELVDASGEQQNEWCELNEEQILINNLKIASQFPVVGKKYFKKHMELFQSASQMIDEIGGLAEDYEMQEQIGPFFDAAKSFCGALVRYNMRLGEVATTKNSAEAERRLGKAFRSLEFVHDDTLVPAYTSIRTKLGRREKTDQGYFNLSSIFTLTKWVIRYWTMLYIVGAFLYNMYYYSDIFVGGAGVMNVMMKVFGCLCLAFTGSAYISTRVVNYAISCFTSLIGAAVQFVPVAGKFQGTKAASGISLTFRYLGTAFLTGWVRSVSRMVCVVAINASALGFVGMGYAIWDALRDAGYKSWTTIQDAVFWLSQVVGDNSQRLFNWFLHFINDVILRGFINGIFGYIRKTITDIPNRIWNSLWSEVPQQTATRVVSTIGPATEAQAALDVMLVKGGGDLTQYSSEQLHAVALKHMEAVDPKLYSELANVLPDIKYKTEQVLEDLVEQIRDAPGIIKEHIDENMTNAAANAGFTKILGELNKTETMSASTKNVMGVMALRDLQKEVTDISSTPAAPPRRDTIRQLLNTKTMLISTLMMLTLALYFAQILIFRS